MRTILLTGWKEGIKKVSLTLLLHEHANYSLSEAKAVTDAVINNRVVRLELTDEQFSRVMSKLGEIGVTFTASLQ